MIATGGLRGRSVRVWLRNGFTYAGVVRSDSDSFIAIEEPAGNEVRVEAEILARLEVRR